MSQKKALMSMWKDTFSVVEYQKVKAANKSTGFEEVPTLENQPCKLSFSTLSVTSEQDMTGSVAQIIKLFCDKDLSIAANSKITVTRAGQTFEFSQSGQPGVFTVHQEIILVPFKGWA